ncbi:RtcB family protein [Thauera phenylacetica]
MPATVGVDIGCGMVAARLSLTANDIDEKRLKKVFDQISRDVPVGPDQHAAPRLVIRLENGQSVDLSRFQDRPGSVVIPVCIRSFH